jgi:molybdopterin molybdotransferase
MIIPMNTAPLSDLDATLGRLLAAARRVKGVDHVPLITCVGRILAEPVVSALAVDGIAAGTELLPAGMLLTPQAIGLAAAIGLDTLPVRRRLSVAVITSSASLSPGASAASTRPLLLALLSRLGCTVEDMGRVPDTQDAMRRILRKAGALHDLVITTSTIPVADEDHVKSAVAAEGEIELCAVAIDADKPLVFGKVGSADFFGLPERPLAALGSFILLLRPFILACQGATRLAPRAFTLAAGFDRPNPAARREFLYARLGADGRLELCPNPSPDSLALAAWADGLIDNPAAQAIRPGDGVRFIPLTELT